MGEVRKDARYWRECIEPIIKEKFISIACVDEGVSSLEVTEELTSEEKEKIESLIGKRLLRHIPFHGLPTKPVIYTTEQG